MSITGLNLFVESPDFKLLSSMHFYGWKRGLKTGMYYLRTCVQVLRQFNLQLSLKRHVVLFWLNMF